MTNLTTPVIKNIDTERHTDASSFCAVFCDRTLDLITIDITAYLIAGIILDKIISEKRLKAAEG